MKQIVAMVSITAALMALIGNAVAGPIELQPATVQEKAAYGANYVLDIKFDHASFDSVTTSNVAWTCTNALPAGSAAKLVLMKLDQAWDAANTESLTVIAGTAGTSNLFLTATQIAADGTEVFYAFPDLAQTTASYVGTNFVTNVINSAQFRYFSTATNLITILTPDSLSALSAWTAGRVRLYWAIYSP